MEIIRDLTIAYQTLENSVVVLGNFDGVHKGHQKLVSKAVSFAHDKNLKSVVFTFNELPLNIIAKKIIVKNIQNTDEKIEVLESLGVDYLICIPFDDSIRTMTPEEFVKNILVHDLKCKMAVCGFNYSFGNMGAGTPQILNSLGKEYGFDVFIMEEFDINGTLVSSTNIRQFLDDGHVEKFAEFTGRNYTIEGKVIEGNRLGNRMGFPTANLNLTPDMAHPGNGVYLTYTYIGEKKYNSITNVGHKPTVGDFDKNAETHIFDFNGDIYGDFLRVEFIKMLRPEQKFASIDELSSQISKDCLLARQLHNQIV